VLLVAIVTLFGQPLIGVTIAAARSAIDLDTTLSTTFGAAFSIASVRYGRVITAWGERSRTPIAWGEHGRIVPRIGRPCVHDKQISRLA
jgi:hypothetical protein